MEQVRAFLLEKLRKEGYEVRFRDFFKIGIPFTLIAVTSGYLFIWLFWRP